MENVNVLVYEVEYTVFATGYSNSPTVTSVRLIDGYSAFEDIRKIIGITRGVNAENILVHAVTEKGMKS